MNLRGGALRALLPLAAAFAVLAGIEAGLHVRRDAPSAGQTWSDFDYFYSDINERFFRRRFDYTDFHFYYETNRPRATHQRFWASKPKGVVRIFVVGGSVASHYADQHNGGLPGLLKRSLPGRDFEVIGCGMGGYDSYRDAQVLDEILDYQPDAVVLMSGNNEYYEPETVNPALYRLTKRLEKLWLYQLSVGRLRALQPPPMTTFAERLALFEKNLIRMAQRAKQRGVPIIFCTLPANVRDSPPLRSKPRVDDESYIDALAALEDGSPLKASRKLALYVQHRPDDPFGHYFLAQSLDRRGLASLARAHYLRALDLDDPGERCSPSRNEIIRRVARENRMIVADLDGAFAGIAKDGLPDSRIFTDAMHWKKDYYGLASWEILRSIHESAHTPGSFLAPAEQWTWNWSEADRRALADPSISTDDAVRYEREVIYKGISYSVQRQTRLSEGAVALFAAAARRDPVRLDEMTESFERFQPALLKYVWLQSLKDPLQRRWSDVALNVGEAYRRMRNYPKALVCFDRSLQLDPDHPDRPLLLKARTLAAMGRTNEAKKLLTMLGSHSRDTPEFAYWRRRIESSTD